MRKFNITIIVMDTMRLDTFKDLSSRKGMELSKFGKFIQFDRCIAPSTWTLPSTASLLTGTYASEHGAHETKDIKCLDIGRIKLKARTMVSDLNDYDYNTYAISANPYFHPIYGFNEFDHFKEEPYFTDVFGIVVEASKKAKLAASKYRNEHGGDLGVKDLFKISMSILKEDPNLFFEAIASGMVMTPIAAAKKLKAKFIDGWPIEKGGRNMVATEKKSAFEKPFFLFVDFMEPHDPYVGVKERDFTWSTNFMKKRADPKLVELWRRLYLKASLRCYKYALEIVKDLIDRFGEDQMIILTSDHGQEFYEHGFLGHGPGLSDEIVRVPLAIMLPKWMKEVRSDKYVSQVSIRAFINSAVKGNKMAMRKLYSDEARSEIFAIPANISFVKGIDVKRMLQSEKPKTRIFKTHG